MKAMLMAAGLGKRMWPLTKHTPKPLLKVGEDSLIERHIKRLAKIGIIEIVINLSYLGQKIQQILGQGEKYGVNISYSVEPECLEVGGGIINALPILGKDPFIVVNGDIWTDYPFERLLEPQIGPVHLVLVENPLHNLAGDYALTEGGWLCREGAPRYTYSGIGRYDPRFLNAYPRQKIEWRQIMEQLISTSNIVSGEHYEGEWFDVGTPERLRTLRKRITEYTNPVEKQYNNE